MSGSRCKALRREFKRQHARVPTKTQWSMRFLEHTTSEWRRVKRDWKRGAA